jgi:DNA-binding YbaB/EbfC family protein
MFKGLGDLANLGAMLKQAQEMGNKMQEAQQQLKTKRVTGTAGAGMVEAEVNGASEVLNVRIDPDLFAKGDREMIEDLIPAAVNQALHKARELHAESMREMTQGMNLPGLGEALAQLNENPPQ